MGSGTLGGSNVETLCFPFALQRRNARSIATANTGVTIEIAKIVVDLFVDRDEEVLLLQISPSDV